MLNFKWKHFKSTIILMAVRWYVAYSLSYRNIEELMKERGVDVDHSTIQRWVIQYSPILENEFRKKYKKKTNGSWRMDETYIKIKGKDCYLYRAVDKEGNTIDFIVTEKRDKKAALSFFTKAIGSSGLPEKVTVDKSGSNKAALDTINFYLFLINIFTCSFYGIEIRQNKYLNNIIEQDHRGIKRITKPMMGFKSIESARATIAGIELHRMLKKGQHKNAENQSTCEQFYALAG